MRDDGVHGRFPSTVTVGGNTIDLGRELIDVMSSYDLAALDWARCDVVLECTSQFNDGLKSSGHLKRGAKSVLISASTKNVDKTIVYGVNHRDLRAEHRLVSNGSCTTNSLTPLTKTLNDTIGIERGIMTRSTLTRAITRCWIIGIMIFTAPAQPHWR